MATHDYNLADAAGAAFRADANNSLSAIVTRNSSASAPSPTFADMIWVDTTNGLVKRRNSSNAGWINLGPRSSVMTQGKSANYTVLPSDFGTYFDCTNTITLALTAAATLGDGFVFEARNSGTGAVTIDPNSTEQINSATTLVLQPGETCKVWCTGGLFRTIGNGPGRVVGVQIFSTPGTSAYTPTPGALTYEAEVLGGGASGGGCASTSAGQAALGAPGGGGGWAWKTGLISAISGATITVGAGGAAPSAGNNTGNSGGTSSIGAVLSATGGSPGLGAAASTSFPALQSAVGQGGVGSSGDVNASGGNGSAPGVMLGSSGGTILGGNGGSSKYSGGGIGKGVSSAGGAAAGFGGGGSGGANLASQSARAGGAGSGGLVIIVERS